MAQSPSERIDGTTVDNCNYNSYYVYNYNIRTSQVQNFGWNIVVMSNESKRSENYGYCKEKIVLRWSLGPSVCAF